MTAYASYVYYRDEWCGTMAKEDYDRLSKRASRYLDTLTMRRIQGAWASDTRVKDACCAVTEELYNQEDGGAAVASESLGSASVSYASGANAKSPDARLRSAAAQYLMTTGLLFCGMG